MAEKIPINAVNPVTDESGKLVGVEDLESGQSIPIEQVSDESRFVCEPAQVTPYSANVGGSRWGSLGDAIGRLADGIKEALEPVRNGVASIYNGAKEYLATAIERAKEDAVAENMKKGAAYCAIKKESSANNGKEKKNDSIAKEGSARAMSMDGGDGLQQTSIKTDEAELSKKDPVAEWPANEEVLWAEALGPYGGEVTTGAVKTEALKREGRRSDRTEVLSPAQAVVEDRPVTVDGDEKAGQAIRDKAEQIEANKIEEKIASEIARASALKDNVNPDKQSSKEPRDNGLTKKDEGAVLDVNSALAQDDRTSDITILESSGEHRAPFDPPPLVSNDISPLAHNFDPPASIAVRMEELFPAVIQNFIGCFTYLQFQKNAHEDDSNSFSHMQIATGERGEQVWPAGKKEGGDNHSDQGSSSGQGQDEKEEQPEIYFPEST